MGKLSGLMLLLPALLSADSMKLKDGQTMHGVVRSIDGGKVTIEIGGEPRMVNILDVEQVDFDTPHTTDAPAVNDVTVHEFTNVAEQLVQAEKDTRRTFDTIKAQWSTVRSVEPAQSHQWAADRERFSAPMASYRKAIRQMYLDLSPHVDNYNKFVGDATKLYVGVKGWLNVGAPLIQDNQRDLPLKDFIPGHWYDQIYYEAYKKGFHDAVEFQALTPR